MFKRWGKQKAVNKKKWTNQKKESNLIGWKGTEKKRYRVAASVVNKLRDNNFDVVFVVVLVIVMKAPSSILSEESNRQ